MIDLGSLSGGADAPAHDGMPGTDPRMRFAGGPPKALHHVPARQIHQRLTPIPAVNVSIIHQNARRPTDTSSI